VRHLLALALGLIWISIVAQPVSACTCANFRDSGNSPLDAAEKDAFAAAAIFEGEPERIELRWSLLKAKEEDLIPADLLDQDAEDSGEPVAVVTFRVLHAYKGDLHSEVQIVTGLGGGDCGRLFIPGLTYLVYAYSGYSPSSPELTVGLCDPGGWIGDPRAAAALRYLRNEPPTRDDTHRWIGLTREQLEAQQKLAATEASKQFESITGQLCGHVDSSGQKESFGDVSFISTKAVTASEHPFVEVNKDGSFCSPRLPPGEYYLYFNESLNDQASYYPGVSDFADARTMKVSAGETQSNIRFIPPPQRTYSVRGLIFTNETPPNGIQTVVLIRLNPGKLSFPYKQSVTFKDNSAYATSFDFENVLPGHYIAYVSGFEAGWFMRKVEFTVESDNEFITLDLQHKK